jgi:acyl-coenzyme A thioesterase PaaI-like protein
MGSIQASSAYTEHVGIEVQPSASGIGAVTVPEGEHLNNHVGSRHAGALFSMGDAAAAALLEATFPSDFVRTLVSGHQKISYERMAKGPLRACARLADGTGIDAVLTIGAGRVSSFEVEIEIVDEDDRVVALMSVEYRVGSWPPSGSLNGNGSASTN